MELIHYFKDQEVIDATFEEVPGTFDNFNSILRTIWVALFGKMHKRQD